MLRQNNVTLSKLHKTVAAKVQEASLRFVLRRTIPDMDYPDGVRSRLAAQLKQIPWGQTLRFVIVMLLGLGLPVLFWSWLVMWLVP